MRGVTNAPQGGGSGGEWTLHTSTNWSDIMEVSGTSIKILKDVIIENNGGGCVFYPKGYVTQANTPLYVPCDTFYNTTTPPGLYRARYARVTGSSEIVGTSVNRTADKYVFTTDGSSITITSSVDVSGTYNKTEYRVFTRD